MNNTKQPLIAKEIEKLFSAPCSHKEVKVAFTLCLFTGARLGELKELKGSDVNVSDDGTHFIAIRHHMSPTMFDRYIPIEIRQLLGERLKPNSYVFPILHNLSPNAIQHHIQSWATAAGLQMSLQFSAARRTYKYLAEIQLYKAGIKVCNYPFRNPISHDYVCGTIKPLSVEQFMRLAQLHDIGVDLSILKKY